MSETSDGTSNLSIANQMIIDSLSALLAMSERLKDEARLETAVVWFLKISTIVAAATATTLSALPGFNMGATIAGAVTVAFTTIQSVEPIGVNRGRKLVAARKLEMVMNSTRLSWNEELLRLSATNFDDNVERHAARLVRDLRQRTEEIASYVDDLVVEEELARESKATADAPAELARPTEELG